MTEKLSNPVDELIPEIASIIAKWQKNQDSAKLEKEVVGLLEKSKKEIYLKLLGFDSRYGSGYQLDHCNGRAGNSPIGQYLYDVQAKAIDEWIQNSAFPVLTKTEEESIRKSMKEEYITRLKRNLIEHIRDKADDDLKTMLSEITRSLNIDDFIKMRDLINQDINNDSLK